MTEPGSHDRRRRVSGSLTPSPVICFSYLANVQTLHVDTYPRINHGVDVQHTDRTWTPVDGETTTIRVPAGPAIRITGGDGTWLVPVGSDQAAHTVIAVIRNRSAAPAAGSAAGPLSSTTG